MSLLRTIDLRGQKLGAAELQGSLPRSGAENQAEIEQRVKDVLAKVHAQGWTAIRDFTETFDGVQLTSLRVPTEVLQSSLAALTPDLRKALEESIARLRTVAQAQRPEDIVTPLAEGASVALRWEPVRRLGVYVPGGLAVYPSSVVMNLVPALVAGVESIALVSPPQKEHGGWPHPLILAAAEMLGITEVYAVGGAQAIAALAYGAPDMPGGDSLAPVDMISGPGNAYVATAKRLVKGVVGIDAEAGPTEIAILADATMPVPYVVADLISQAEHDPQAAAVLITTDADVVEKVQTELIQQIQRSSQAQNTSYQERLREALSGPQSAIILVDSLEQGITVANAYAAEHLEIITAKPAEVAAQIHSAGAIFLGPYAPVSLGDYCAGSNHVLPTAGTARFSSGLSVYTFLRALQVIDYNQEALAKVARSITVLAEAEQLPAHAAAVQLRIQKE